jgi:hypothetical protein
VALSSIPLSWSETGGQKKRRTFPRRRIAVRFLRNYRLAPNYTLNSGGSQIAPAHAFHTHQKTAAGLPRQAKSKKNRGPARNERGSL